MNIYKFLVVKQYYHGNYCIMAVNCQGKSFITLAHGIKLKIQQ